MLAWILFAVVCLSTINAQDIAEINYYSGIQENIHTARFKIIQNEELLKNSKLTEIIDPLFRITSSFMSNNAEKQMKDHADYLFFLSLFTPVAQFANTSTDLIKGYEDALIVNSAKMGALLNSTKTKETIVEELRKEKLKYPVYSKTSDEDERLAQLYSDAYTEIVYIGYNYFHLLKKNLYFAQNAAKFYNVPIENIKDLFESTFDLLLSITFDFKIKELVPSINDGPPQLTAFRLLQPLQSLQDLRIEHPKLVESPIYFKLLDLSHKMADGNIPKTLQDNADFFLYLYILSNYLELPQNSLLVDEKLRKVILYASEEAKAPSNLNQAIGEYCLYKHGFYKIYDQEKNDNAERTAAEIMRLHFKHLNEDLVQMKPALTVAFVDFAKIAADYFQRLSEEDSWIKAFFTSHGVNELILKRFYEFSSFILSQIPLALDGKYDENGIKQVLCSSSSLDVIDSQQGRVGSSVAYFEYVSNLYGITSYANIPSLWPMILIIAATSTIRLL